jgi:hypothetical protein
MRIPRLLDWYWHVLKWKLGGEVYWFRLVRHWCVLFGHRWEQLEYFDGGKSEYWMCRLCGNMQWPGIGAKEGEK